MREQGKLERDRQLEARRKREKSQTMLEKRCKIPNYPRDQPQI